MLPVIETPRLVLRMLRASDFEVWAEMHGDAEVMRYLGDGKAMDRPTAWRGLAAMIGHWSLRGYGIWAVEERATGKFAGRIGFWNPEGWPGFELGWALHRPFWGKGYATEGARAALRVAFKEPGQPEVISLTHPENAASIRVAERLGERLTGTAEIFGKQVQVYRITREEWQVGAGGA
ncbi:MAG TPA: GNAT family N-acetyltransferase [Verrucomicrobiales bacterium]|nr:GNAT family N-acetyltransferase [Verrucomicrobiales bacterium]